MSKTINVDKLREENKALKGRWEKLKEFIKDRDDAWLDFKYILNKMKELEDRQ